MWSFSFSRTWKGSKILIPKEFNASSDTAYLEKEPEE